MSGHKYATVMRHAARTFRLTLAGKPAESSVACGGCTACCRENQGVRLQPGEVPDPRLRHDGTHLLRQPDGSCTHLVEGGCEVYDVRPQICRAYDCRVGALAGVTEDVASESLRAGYARVSPPRDAEDLEYFFALKILMAKARQRDPSMTPSIAAANALAALTPQALAAGTAELAAMRKHALVHGIDEAEASREACRQLAGPWTIVRK